MRISDWSSDVCSSDLSRHPLRRAARLYSARSRRRRWQCAGALEAAGQARVRRGGGRCGQWLIGPISLSSPAGLAARKGVVVGKRVSVRVVLGGGRILKKKKSKQKNQAVKEDNSRLHE